MTRTLERGHGYVVQKTDDRVDLYVVERIGQGLKAIASSAGTFYARYCSASQRRVHVHQVPTVGDLP